MVQAQPCLNFNTAFLSSLPCTGTLPLSVHGAPSHLAVIIFVSTLVPNSSPDSLPRFLLSFYFLEEILLALPDWIHMNNEPLYFL
jgi:hypothetical protein